jgi:2-methylisocitrate lyase-like PEP mutase family enzyme
VKNVSNDAPSRMFRTLHELDVGFVMPNAWDAGSALVLAREGFGAIGTTSAGIAFSLGKQDYHVTDGALAVTRQQMFTRMREIVDAVRVPVNGDLEAGYGDEPEAVAETVRMAMAAGLAGGNLEDKRPLEPALYDDVLATERVAAARAAIVDAGSAFVLTARTDTYQVLRDDALAHAISRANRYLQAGADCVFVPGVADLPTIKTLVREIDGPLNLVAGLVGGAGSPRAMLEAGVQRVSLGGTIARSVYAFIRQCARELRDNGSLDFAREQMSGSELNELFMLSRKF